MYIYLVRAHHPGEVQGVDCGALGIEYTRCLHVSEALKLGSPISAIQILFGLESLRKLGEILR